MRKLVVFAFLATLPLTAQPFGKSDPGGFRHEVRASLWNWNNFYWSTEPQLERDMRAFGFEYRAAYRPQALRADVYGHLNYLNYDETARDDSYGGRIGIADFNPVREFNVYLDRGQNRQSFTAGNVVAQANVTTLGAEYRRAIGPAWMITSEAAYAQQRFDVESPRDNDYTTLGAGIRYRGFGWRFAPEVGYIVSHLATKGREEDYDDRQFYVQAEYMPHFVPDGRLYLNGRYGFKNRDYEVAPGDVNFGRTDDRPELSLVAAYRIRSNIQAIGYYAREDVRSTVPGQDFDYDLFTLTLSFGL